MLEIVVPRLTRVPTEHQFCIYEIECTRNKADFTGPMISTIADPSCQGYEFCVPRYNCKGASTRPAIKRNNPAKTNANLIPNPPIK